jgi:Mitochondrial ribosomal death-associated protein 3
MHLIRYHECRRRYSRAALSRLPHIGITAAIPVDSNDYTRNGDKAAHGVNSTIEGVSRNGSSPYFAKFSRTFSASGQHSLPHHTRGQRFLSSSTGNGSGVDKGKLNPEEKKKKKKDDLIEFDDSHLLLDDLFVDETLEATPKTPLEPGSLFGNNTIGFLNSVDYEDDGNDSDSFDQDSSTGNKHITDEERQQKEELKKEMELKKGRGWSDPWDLQDLYDTKLDFESLPDWTPDVVSQVSQERLKLFRRSTNDSDKAKSPTIPTLQELASMPLPQPAPPHPGLGQAKAYARFRKRQHIKYVKALVRQAISSSVIDRIRSLDTWDEKQYAIDELYETVEQQLRAGEDVLSLHPSFSSWVERAIEEHLRQIQKQPDSGEKGSDLGSVDANPDNNDTAKLEIPTTSRAQFVSPEEDESALPMFMDCFDPSDPSDQIVPSILHPLVVADKTTLTHTPRINIAGKMAEEWELAAHKSTKRIMLRQCTRTVSQIVYQAIASEPDSGAKTYSPACLYIDGRLGTGKSTVLASIVAAARNDRTLDHNCIVLYVPDGDRYRKNGFFVEPNLKRPGMFDIPNLSQEVCQALLQSHRQELESLQVDSSILERFFTESQLSRVPGAVAQVTVDQTESDDLAKDGVNSVSAISLLELGASNMMLAPMCYSSVVFGLTQQTKHPFLMVFDEMNCYYDRGRYYHMEYDSDVKEPMPYHRISLFEPVMDVLGLKIKLAKKDVDEIPEPTFALKRGAVIVATTEKHAVARKATDLLGEAARQAAAERSSFHVVPVPRLSPLEVEHMVAHFEATGVGKLRGDRGETVMNDQEVIYLRMISGGVAQKLMDASIIA